jgi:hypothetical protein
MASERIQCLISLRPFKGIDTLSAGIDVQPGRARQGIAADPYRLPLALVSARGRVQLAEMTTGGVGAVVKNIAAYTSGPTDQEIIGTTELAGVFNRFMFDPLANTQTPLNFGGTVDTTFFSQAVQFGNVIYDNAGHQYSSANPGNTFLWHYPAPDPTAQAYSVTPVAGTLPGGPLGNPATYFYAFTQTVTSFPVATGFSQETSPTGPTPTGNPLSVYSVTSSGATGALITGVFAGSMPDGATYVTNVYRQSTLSGIWFLRTTLTTNAPFTDNADDSTIAGNAILDYNRDIPPVTPTNLGAIFRHQERMWAFLIIDDDATANQPQSQLWFTNAARPWEWNNLPIQDGGNVMLVGNSDTPSNNTDYTAQYGDWPVRGVSLSSVAILFKSKSMHAVYGTDQTNFVAQPIFNKGSRSPNSIVVAPTDTGTACFFLASDRTVNLTDGQSLVYLSECIRATLEALTDADVTGAVGFYSHHTYWLSFPVLGKTFGYNTSAGEWIGPLPYTAFPNAVSTLSNPVIFGSPTSDTGEVLAARPGTNFIDQWFAGGDLDLGAAQLVQWTGSQRSGASPGPVDDQQLGAQKTFCFLLINAPVQPGLMAAVTLTVDGNSESKVFNLGNGYTTHIIDVDADRMCGFLGSLEVSFSTGASTAPAQVWAVEAYGVTRLNLLPQADDV